MEAKTLYERLEKHIIDGLDGLNPTGTLPTLEAVTMLVQAARASLLRGKARGYEEDAEDARLRNAVSKRIIDASTTEQLIEHQTGQKGGDNA